MSGVSYSGDGYPIVRSDKLGIDHRGVESMYLLEVENDWMTHNQSTNDILIAYKFKKDFVPGEIVYTFFRGS